MLLLLLLFLEASTADACGLKGSEADSSEESSLSPAPSGGGLCRVRVVVGAAAGKYDLDDSAAAGEGTGGVAIRTLLKWGFGSSAFDCYHFGFEFLLNRNWGRDHEKRTVKNAQVVVQVGRIAAVRNRREALAGSQDLAPAERIGSRHSEARERVV
jgi:hypothetical protein